MQPSVVVGHRHKKKTNLLDQVEEHSVSIILSLLRFCKQENIKRVVNKFTELNLIKTERLVELYLKYSDKLIQCDKQIESEGYDLDEEGTRKEFFLRRLNDGGLFQLQLIDHIILLLSNMDDTIKQTILKLINMHSKASKVDHVQFIKRVIQDMVAEKDSETEQGELLELVKNF